MFSGLFGKRKTQVEHVAVRETQVGDFVAYSSLEQRLPQPYPPALYPPLAEDKLQTGAAPLNQGGDGQQTQGGGGLDGVPFVVATKLECPKDVETLLTRIRDLGNSLAQLDYDYTLERRILMDSA